MQARLADHPELLVGDAVGRYLLVRREAGVPGEAGGSDRWSVDHLFLDQEGVPTLVETKRSSDTRLRREVVGQGLDYAANAVAYWPPDRVRAEFESSCAERGVEATVVLEEFLGEDRDIEAFWETVRLNFEAKKIRLVFVADVIPPELQRVIEF